MPNPRSGAPSAAGPTTDTDPPADAGPDSDADADADADAAADADAGPTTEADADAGPATDVRADAADPGAGAGAGPGTGAGRSSAAVAGSAGPGPGDGGQGPAGDPPWWRRITPAAAVLAATWLVVALGTGLRIRAWSTGRPFWLDELLLLRAMTEQRFSQLLQPLDLAQSAPPGWLAVQHVMVGLSGGDERVSRLVPLLFGIAGLVVAVPLFRLLLGGPAALAATALVALSPTLIWFSDEFKQYSADAFWVPLVLLVGCRIALRDQRRRRDWAALAGSTAVAVWFSHAGALVTAGVLAALGILMLARRRFRELPVLLACAVPFAAGLAVEYATLLSRNTANEVLQDYWADAFPPDGPLTREVALDWLADRAASVARNPLTLSYGWPLLVLLVAGLLVLGLRRPAALPVLLAPVLVVAAAGLAGAYPIDNRLALWLVPIVALVLAATLDLPALAAGPRLRAVRVPAAVLAAVLTVAALTTLVVLVRPQVDRTATYAGEPRLQEDSRTVLAAIAAQRRPDDLVLIDYRASGPAAWFYGARLGVGPVQALQPARSTPACAGRPLGRSLREAGRHPRVWLFTVHARTQEMRLYHEVLASFGPRVDAITAPEAEAELYERSPVPVPGPARTPCARVVPAPLG